MTVTTICRLPESSAPSVTCLWTSISFTCYRPHARRNVKSCLSTQRPGPSATLGRDFPRCDASAHHSGITPGSSASRRQTSFPGLRLHHAPTPVCSEIECVRALSSMFTWRLYRPRHHSWQGPPTLLQVREAIGRQPCLVSLTQTDLQTLGSSSPHPFPVHLEIGRCGCRGANTAATVVQSHYHLHHQAAQVMSHLSVSMF